MYLLGLTGGISTGKSTVSNLLKSKYKVAVIDLDDIASHAVELGQPALKQIKQEFGGDIFLASGALNRSKLGEIIFKDEAKRKKLEEITHPRILRECVRQVLGHYLFGCDLVVIDAPLLYEAKMDKWMHENVVVYCVPQVQLKRLMERDGIRKAEAQLKIDSQMSLEFKRDKCSYLIENSEDLARTHRQVEKLVRMVPSGHTLLSRLIWLLTWCSVFWVWTILNVMKWFKI